MRDAPTVEQEVFPDFVLENLHQLGTIARRLEVGENGFEEVEAEEGFVENCSTLNSSKKVGRLSVGL